MQPFACNKGCLSGEANLPFARKKGCLSDKRRAFIDVEAAFLVRPICALHATLCMQQRLPFW